MLLSHVFINTFYYYGNLNIPEKICGTDVSGLYVLVIIYIVIKCLPTKLINRYYFQFLYN